MPNTTKVIFNNNSFQLSGVMNYKEHKFCCLCKKQIPINKEKACGNNEYECPECWEIIEGLNKKK